MHSKEFLGGLAEFFKLFSDETRIRILDLLVTGEKSVNEISKKLDVSQSAVSHQLKTLRSSNLVKANKIGQMVNYSIKDKHIEIILKYGIEHLKEIISEWKLIARLLKLL